MPVFFLLSGFCLTLGYGKKKYTRSTLCCGSCQTTSGCDCRPCRKQPDSNEEIFDSWEFYFGRVSRILPVYYLTLILAIPQIPLGCFWFAPSDLFSSFHRSRHRCTFQCTLLNQSLNIVGNWKFIQIVNLSQLCWGFWFNNFLIFSNYFGVFDQASGDQILLFQRFGQSSIHFIQCQPKRKIFGLEYWFWPNMLQAHHLDRWKSHYLWLKY